MINPYDSPRGVERETLGQHLLLALRWYAYRALLIVFVLGVLALWPLFFLLSLKDHRPAVADWLLLLAWGLALATWLPLLTQIVSR